MHLLLDDLRAFAIRRRERGHIRKQFGVTENRGERIADFVRGPRAARRPSAVSFSVCVTFACTDRRFSSEACESRTRCASSRASSVSLRNTRTLSSRIAPNTSRKRKAATPAGMFFSRFPSIAIIGSERIAPIAIRAIHKLCFSSRSGDLSSMGCSEGPNEAATVSSTSEKKNGVSKKLLA